MRLSFITYIVVSPVLAMFAADPKVMANDPLGGWGSLILQGGAFALLTYLVTVIAPATLKATKEERESRDKRFEEMLTLLQDRFDERNTKIVRALEVQTVSLSGVIEKSMTRVENAVGNACHTRDQK